MSVVPGYEVCESLLRSMHPAFTKRAIEECELDILEAVIHRDSPPVHSIVYRILDALYHIPEGYEDKYHHVLRLVIESFPSGHMASSRDEFVRHCVTRGSAWMIEEALRYTTQKGLYDEHLFQAIFLSPYYEDDAPTLLRLAPVMMFYRRSGLTFDFTGIDEEAYSGKAYDKFVAGNTIIRHA